MRKTPLLLLLLLIVLSTPVQYVRASTHRDSTTRHVDSYRGGRMGRGGSGNNADDMPPPARGDARRSFRKLLRRKPSLLMYLSTKKRVRSENNPENQTPPLVRRFFWVLLCYLVSTNHDETSQLNYRVHIYVRTQLL